MEKQKNISAFIENVNGKMVAIASDNTVDRHGDSLDIDSWDLVNFKKNPVLQWAHDYSIPPIGLAKNIRKEGGKLIFDPVFHGLTDLSKDVERLFDGGFMKAFSVGFIPHVKESGTDNQVTKLELLEISAVPVPANPAAIVLEKSINQTVEKEVIAKIEKWNTKAFDKVEEKVGKVLSKKTKTVVQNAIDALQDLISMNEAQTVEDEEEKTVTNRIEIKEFNDGKGRSQDDLNKSLEAINNQLGFIARKLKN